MKKTGKNFKSITPSRFLKYSLLIILFCVIAVFFTWKSIYTANLSDQSYLLKLDGLTYKILSIYSLPYQISLTLLQYIPNPLTNLCNGLSENGSQSCAINITILLTIFLFILLVLYFVFILNLKLENKNKIFLYYGLAGYIFGFLRMIFFRKYVYNLGQGWSHLNHSWGFSSIVLFPLSYSLIFISFGLFFSMIKRKKFFTATCLLVATIFLIAITSP